MASPRGEARRAARRYDIDPDIFERQIGQESNFRRGARSPAGAQGIAQFMPATARAYGVNLNDNRISDDLDGAARYMRDLLRQFDGDYRLALAGYNAGGGNARRAVTQFPETRNYVQRILGGASPRQQRGVSGGEGSESSPRPAPREAGPPQERGDTGALVDLLRQGMQRSPVPVSAPASPAFSASAVMPAAYQAAVPSVAPAPRARLDEQIAATATLRGPEPAAPERAEVVPGEAVTREGSEPDEVRKIFEEADAISRARVPYQWGGGHAGRQPRGSKVTPLDCSGAVSRVLGMDPRVSGQFETWGKPGRGRNVTVYANDEHVLMEINGRFWGTSKANPRGGAGWIPRSAISKEYLSRFTARHPAGL